MNFFKKIVQLKLKFFARRILKKYKPKVIGITGSIGKTSSKEAIISVLSAKYRTRGNIKNYNNEIGLPLTIIGCESPARSAFGWLAVFLKATKLIIFKDKSYPEVLILEMGVDRPGDMDYLLQIVKCDIGLITFIGPTHMEFFGSREKIQKEKGKLVEKIEKNGWAILNFDNDLSSKLKQNSKVKVLTYGFKEGADLKAQDLLFNFVDSQQKQKAADLIGISFKLKYDGAIVPIWLPKVIGYQAVYAALAATAVGICFDLNLVEISQALQTYISPRGRMNLIPGIKKTLIIDDTYNSSPPACLSGLDMVEKINLDGTGRKIAVLGDMLELGRESESLHIQVGQALVKAGIDVLFAIGEKARDIARGAQEAGLSKDKIFQFANSEESKKFIQNRIEKGDLLFVKGSQGMRMEIIVEEIMAEPLKAKELLVRQGEEWKKI